MTRKGLKGKLYRRAVNRHSRHGLKQTQERGNKNVLISCLKLISCNSSFFFFCFFVVLLVVRSIARTLNFKFIKLFLVFFNFLSSFLPLQLIFLEPKISIQYYYKTRVELKLVLWFAKQFFFICLFFEKFLKLWNITLHA